ncbi:MAG: hypothetical protein QOD99_312, partial [Chthoniobacter sp.]|nr:hypothetical protein [Chthoniobacter sp.]
MKIAVGVGLLLSCTAFAVPDPYMYKMYARDVPDHLATNIAKTDPGAIIDFGNLSPNGFGIPLLLQSPGDPEWGVSTLTILSLKGATLEPGNEWYPDDQHPEAIEHLPFTMRFHKNVCHASFHLRIKVKPLNRNGHSEPVQIRFHSRIEFRGFPPGSGTDAVTDHPFTDDEIITYTLPVSDVPVLSIACTVNTPNPGEFRAGGSGQYLFNAEAPGAQMEDFTIKARAPKGTAIVPNTVAPAGFTQSGNELTWVLPGPLTKFYGAFGVRVKDRPGTKTATANFNAAARVQDFARAGAKSSKTPIRAFDRGKIDYQAENGLNGEVKVGEEVFFECSDWDPEGGDILVSLNDVGLTIVPLSAPFGTFVVPPFRDPDLEHVLTAQQKGKPVDQVVKGKPEAVAEASIGSVVIVDENATALRRLAEGGQTAVGEVKTEGGALDSGSQFGLLRIDSATSAVLLRFLAASDTRLLFARGGDVRVYGAIQVGQLRVDTGGRKKIALNYTPNGDFSAYNTKDQATGDNVIVGITTGARTIQGPAYATNWTHTGNINLDGGILFIEGDTVITGDVAGQG